MRRIVSKCLAATAALFLLAGSGTLLGQPTPTPTPGPSAGPGPWSSAHPLWFDLNGDGSPQAGELTGSPELVGEGCTRVVGYPAVIGSSESPCAEVYEDAGVGGSLMRPNGVMQRVSTNEDGTLFTFTEEDYETPTRQGSGMRPLAVRATGTGQLLGLNGGGSYESLQVQGSRPSGPVPQTRMSLVPRDAGDLFGSAIEGGDAKPRIDGENAVRDRIEDRSHLIWVQRRARCRFRHAEPPRSAGTLAPSAGR